MYVYEFIHIYEKGRPQNETVFLLILEETCEDTKTKRDLFDYKEPNSNAKIIY